MQHVSGAPNAKNPLQEDRMVRISAGKLSGRSVCAIFGKRGISSCSKVNEMQREIAKTNDLKEILFFITLAVMSSSCSMITSAHGNSTCAILLGVLAYFSLSYSLVLAQE